MAYSVLISLSQLLEQIMPHHQDYICLCEKDQMESLHSNVISLQKLLEDFTWNRNPTIKRLESRITDVAYQLEDIIGSEISNRSTCLIDGHDARLLSLEHMFSTFGSCIEEVRSIVEVAMEVKKSLKEETRVTSAITRGVNGEATKVGLDKDLIQIQKRVSHGNALQIIPIVGMGGIGKTTLAKTVYENQSNRFDFRSWATVSQEYYAQKILAGILSDPEAITEEDVESLIERVHKELTGRRFLIVIDDIWDAQAWDSIMRAFPNDNNGSSIILTTRLVDVAEKIDSSRRLHEMQLLNEDQSWRLFKEEVYGRNRFCPHQMETIGRTISKNCKGLPLAIVVIASLLKLNVRQDYWERFAKNINEALSVSHDDQLLEILSLSYNNLPHHLKACFLYMSIFPEDYEIPSKKLIMLWVAEGFLKPVKDKSMEKVAAENLEDLVKRNLVSVSKKRYNDSIKTCSIHDILRELSLRKAEEEKFLQHFMCRYITGKPNPMILYQRRLCVTNASLPSLQHDTNYKPVRSLLFPYSCTPELSFSTFRLLRVLDALQITIFPVDELFSLVNLRYLSFTFSTAVNVAMLESLCKLDNLEILIIKVEIPRGFYHGASWILKFPILKLSKLRHFFLLGKERNYRIYHQIDEVDKIRSILGNTLQTLSGLTNIKFTECAVKTFENLTKLKVGYYDIKPKEWESFCLNSLIRLRQLEELSLRFGKYFSTRTIHLPTNLTFPHKLKKLSLFRSIISWEKMSVIGYLPNLEELKLKECSFESREWEPVEGEFQLLRYLKLELHDLEHWRAESIHFPCLEQLIIRYAYKLREVPIDIGDIATLKKLVIYNCNNCVEDSARRIQEEQQKYDNFIEVVVAYTRRQILTT